MITVSCLQFLGQAASIADMCITPDEFLQRVGDFGQYCPVSLADKNELIDCSTNVTLKFAAEFRGMYPTPLLKIPTGWYKLHQCYCYLCTSTKLLYKQYTGAHIYPSCSENIQNDYYNNNNDIIITTINMNNFSVVCSCCMYSVLKWYLFCRTLL